MGSSGPQELTLPVVVTAALVDSINPCAFAVLLTFIAATLVLAERASARGARARWFLWRMGLVYVIGVFDPAVPLDEGVYDARRTRTSLRVGAVMRERYNQRVPLKLY